MRYVLCGLAVVLRVLPPCCAEIDACIAFPCGAGQQCTDTVGGPNDATGRTCTGLSSVTVAVALTVMTV